MPPKRTVKINQALISTAFQDHIIKQLDLSNLLADPNVCIKNKKPTIKLPQIKSKVDSGLVKPNRAKQSKNSDDEPKEFVIKATESSSELPTLAEKLGLVAINQERVHLNENEWTNVKDKYKLRGDFKQPCVICKEQLGLQQQVLLSCTHTFHRSCLEVFERFSGKKSCPMCRKERYETRVVHDASKYYKDLCAAKIQAAWRGYLVRKWYKNYRRLVPPQNPELRKKFFQEKLSEITDRLVMSFNMSRDEFLESIERNLAESRRTFQDFEVKFSNNEALSDSKWKEILDRAIYRDHDECSICINKYVLPKEIKATNKTETGFNFSTYPDEQEEEFVRKPLVLLSCSHVFHSVCLRTFEELSFDRTPVCPECRALYKKRELVF